MRRTVVSICVLLACAAACSKGDSTTAASTTGPSNPTPTPPVNTGPAPTVAATVNATPALAFDPSDVTIKVGQAVAFAFGSIGHNVIFSATAGAPGDIVGVNMNTSISRTFSTAGTFAYACTIHPNMTGSVTVQ